MSFSGNLEHLPIVDVIQLLNSTKKTGTLLVNTDILEYKIGFNDGHIVSVTHPDTNMSLIKVIKEKKIIDDITIDTVLENIKDFSRPLIVELLEKNVIDSKTALAVLQSLVELTVVDILTWDKGNFQLFVDRVELEPNFQYLSNILKGNFYISIQNTLMEALRIFDEMRRDNLLSNGIFKNLFHKAVDSTEEEIVITEDILGLDNVDKIERRIPSVFKCIDAQDFAEPHRKKVLSTFPDINRVQEDLIVNYLLRYSQNTRNIDMARRVAIILYTKDEFTSYVINTIANSMKIFIFTTDSEENLSIIMRQSLSKQLIPIIIVDCSSVDDTSYYDRVNSFKKDLINKCPIVRFIHFVEWNNEERVLTLLKEGALAVFPKPLPIGENVDKIINFYEALVSYIEKLNFSEMEELNALSSLANKLTNVQKIAEIIDIYLDLISKDYNRCGLLVNHRDEFFLEKVKGIKIDTLPKKIILSQSFITKLQDENVIKGKIDREMAENFFSLLGKPEDEDILILALKGGGKLIAIIYADSPQGFNYKETYQVLQSLIGYAIDLMLFRKMFDKSKKTE